MSVLLFHWLPDLEQAPVAKDGRFALRTALEDAYRHSFGQTNQRIVEASPQILILTEHPG